MRHLRAVRCGGIIHLAPLSGRFSWNNVGAERSSGEDSLPLACAHSFV